MFNRIIIKKKFIACCAAVLLFSACSAEQEPSANDIPIDQYGNLLNGLREVKYDRPGVPNEYVLDGYTYLAQSSGTAYNSVDDPELFKAGEIPPVISRPYYSDYLLTYEGTEWGGLTLTEASSVYLFYPESDSHAAGYVLQTTYAVFSGTLTLRGYATSALIFDSEEELMFAPADGEWDGLPIIWCGWMGGYTKEDFEILTDMPNISLGATADSGLEFSEEEVKFVEPTIKKSIGK